MARPNIDARLQAPEHPPGKGQLLSTGRPKIVVLCRFSGPYFDNNKRALGSLEARVSATHTLKKKPQGRAAQ